MVNQTLKVLLETMAKNSPYTLGTDYAVSINQDNEKSFSIFIFHDGNYAWFIPVGLLTLCLAYAAAFRLHCYCKVLHGVPVIALSRD